MRAEFNVVSLVVAVIPCPRTLEMAESFRQDVKHLWFLDASSSRSCDWRGFYEGWFCGRLWNYDYQFFLRILCFIIPCSGQGDAFMDPALLDNLREHHVSGIKGLLLLPFEWALWFYMKPLIVIFLKKNYVMHNCVMRELFKIPDKVTKS